MRVRFLLCCRDVSHCVVSMQPMLWSSEARGGWMSGVVTQGRPALVTWQSDFWRKQKWLLSCRNILLKHLTAENTVGALSSRWFLYLRMSSALNQRRCTVVKYSKCFPFLLFPPRTSHVSECLPVTWEYRTSNINSCKRSTGTQGWLLTGWMMAARGPGGGGLRWRWRWRWAVQGAVLGEWMMKRI